jgi:hypothetical protein
MAIHDHSQKLWNSLNTRRPRIVPHALLTGARWMGYGMHHAHLPSRCEGLASRELGLLSHRGSPSMQSSRARRA